MAPWSLHGPQDHRKEIRLGLHRAQHPTGDLSEALGAEEAQRLLQGSLGRYFWWSFYKWCLYICDIYIYMIYIYMIYMYIYVKIPCRFWDYWLKIYGLIDYDWWLLTIICGSWIVVMLLPLPSLVVETLGLRMIWTSWIDPDDAEVNFHRAEMFGRLLLQPSGFLVEKVWKGMEKYRLVSNDS